MTDRKTVVARSLVEATIIKDFEAAHKKTRAELATMFVDPGDREVGKLNDHRLGSVALEAGREYWRVVDEDAFLIWVAANHPGEIVKAVRSSFRDAILAECKRDGGVLIDVVTGEVAPPPGVELRKGAPMLVERTDAHASWVIREFLGDAAEKLGIGAGRE